MKSRPGIRAAAAFLESFTPGDRRWLLAQLPAETGRLVEAEGSSLPEHLRTSRLRELLPLLADTGPAVTSTARRKVATSFESVLDAEELKRLAGMDVASVQAALEDCPDWFCAALIRLRDWPWQSRLMAARPGIHRSKAAPALEMKPAARLALIRLLSNSAESRT